MPFLSYQVSVEEAVQNAGRLYKEARADAIKLEEKHTYKMVEGELAKLENLLK